MQITETPGPACHKGRGIIHAADEPWIVKEDTGEIGRRGPKGRPARFRTSPVDWFSCTECAMNGTVSYLRMLLSGGVRRYLQEAALRQRATIRPCGGESVRPD